MNDGAVMTGWAKDQGTSGSIIKLLGDPRSEFTQALGLVLDHPGPMAVLGNPRCKRFSMLVDDCVIKTLNVAASDDDPAGDGKPEVSMVDQMLKDLAPPAQLDAATPPMFPSIISISAMALISLFISSGVSIAVLRFRRGASTVSKEPLLEA